MLSGVGEDGCPGTARGAEVAALFAAVAGIGPFFAVATGPEPAGGGWVPVRALSGRVDAAGGAGGADPLDDRIEAVRAALRTDRRVAASIAFQGLAAQVVSPLFAAVALRGALPVPPGPDGEIAGALRWRPGGAGPWLWWPGAGAVVPCADGELAVVLTGLLGPLVTAVRERVSVSPRVLWGDVASAVASARRLVCAARPAASARPTDVAGTVLATAPLAATVELRPPVPPDATWTFRRRSCCLHHRAPGGGLCDDCVLRDRRPRT